MTEGEDLELERRRLLNDARRVANRGEREARMQTETTRKPRFLNDIEACETRTPVSYTEFRCITGCSIREMCRPRFKSERESWLIQLPTCSA